MAAYRSLLFVPGDRPERFAKAKAAGADAMCVDLEDAVAPDRKAQARDAALAWLQGPEASGGACAAGLRVNHPATPDGARDLDALADLARGGFRPAFVMVPKAAAAGDLAGLAGQALWPVVESAEGLRAAWDIAAAPGVAGVLFGGADYAADIGCDMDWDALAWARGRLAAAAARAGVALLDVPHLDIKDEAGLAASTRRVRAMGFTGRACIHPAQVAAVNAVFTPDAAALAHARAVIAALEAAGGRAALLDGKLIERPVARAAERVLERARRAGLAD